jgi:2-oxoglutarate dehydrogenase E1 component
MTPKSLLRHLEAVSTLEECAQGTFRRILPDTFNRPADGIKRIILCTGKIYYELDQYREKTKHEDVAVLRLEQLYPFPQEELYSTLGAYAEGTPVFWVQEEPMNMGAWRHMRIWLGQKICGRFPFSGIYRPASASPATGSASSHKQEQEQLIKAAFGD